ncbi:MAG: lipopolysaccharide biosynthesis protein, partial [bacterium]
FWANIAGGLVLFGICTAMAPLAARFFKNELVAPVLIVSSIGLLISSFGVVHRASLLRRLDFKAVAVADIGSSFGYGTVSILLAALGFGVWALVYGTLFGSFVGVVLWWIGFRWRPSFSFSGQKFLDLFRFGANVMGTGIVGYCHQNVDYLVIGRRLGAFPLGIYTLAFKLVSLPLTKISYVVTGVTFPAFSRMQDDDARLRRGYTKTVRYISLFAFPVLAGLMLLAPQFVRVIYGPKWLGAVIPLRIMCVLGMLKAVGTTVGSVLKAKGRPDIEFKYNLLLLVGMSLAVLTGSLHGIVGVALAVTLLVVIAFPMIQAVTNRLITLSFKDYLRSLWPAAFASSGMALLLFVWKSLLIRLVPGGNLLVLLSSTVLGILLYWGILRLIGIEEIKEFPLILSQFPLLGRLFRETTGAKVRPGFMGSPR